MPEPAGPGLRPSAEPGAPGAPLPLADQPPPVPVALPPGAAVVEFASDLHLSAGMPRTLAAFEGWLAQTRADAVFLLGDLFEVWPGDDALSLPFEQQVAAVLALAAQQRPVHVQRGNRDFLLGPAFFEATGCLDLPDPCAVSAFGQTVVLSHGDALCLADVDYQRFRAQVRQPAWQAALLARPLAERLALAAQMRDASRSHNQARDPVTFADADPALAGQWLQQAGARVLIHGHTHRPASEQRPEGWQRHVLSDWDLDGPGPARAEVLRWSTVGFERLTVGG